ncbi:MAG: hypothetical protein ABIW30_00125, partial [Arenimonas sp.]
VVWRGAISERLVPDAQLNQQLVRAQAALARGKLSAADGTGAREVFESVLAADPDQMNARQGLIDVRNAAIARAQLALGGHRRLEATQNLALAQALSAPEVQLQSLRAQLRDLENALGDASVLLAQASAPGVSDDVALSLLNRALQLEPDNAIALDGRRIVLARWLTQAESKLAAGEVRAAQELVDRVVADDPAHLDLPPVQGELGEALARVQNQQARAQLFAQADERAGNLDRAAARYLTLQRNGADPATVEDDLQRVATRMAVQAQRQAEDFQFARAEASLAKARRWSPQAPAIAVAEQGLQQSRRAQRRLLHAPGHRERAQLPARIADAEKAMARGDFVTPPGTSAWDQLRAAIAIAPDAPSVQKLQREFKRRTRECFEQALTANQIKRAQSCLEARLLLEPGLTNASEARHSIADRWLAYAEERIGASDYATAEKALQSVRHWQPAHPMLKATEARLRKARGASR